MSFEEYREEPMGLGYEILGKHHPSTKILLPLETIKKNPVMEN
jgi:hypothetical protein